MHETLRVILTKFTDETITISLMVLLVLFSILVIYWLYNRKKYRELTHQIPASVVKSYLDSIIQNSTALKSSLFRGGGLDVGNGIPSVVPAKDFPSSHVEVGSASVEELNQKNAEIAALNGRLRDKERIVSDLEQKLHNMKAQLESSGDDLVKEMQKQLDAANARIAELEAELAKAKSTGAEDPEAKAKLVEVSKERDELKERLAEYEIIEDDIANLKKYKQENEQLRKSLAAYEGGATPVEATEAGLEPEQEPELESEPEFAPEPEPVEEKPAMEDDLEAQMAAAINESQGEPVSEPEAEIDSDADMSVDEPEAMVEAEPTPGPGDALPEEGDAEQKSAEELLSEFEKMLG